MPDELHDLHESLLQRTEAKRRPFGARRNAKVHRRTSNPASSFGACGIVGNLTDNPQEVTCKRCLLHKVQHG